MKKTFLTALGVFIAGITIILVLCVIIAFPIKWLWNSCLVGTVDGIHAINFWKALGLSVLFGLLVRSGSSNTSKKD